MSVEIEYDNGTPVAISWALGDNPIAFLSSEHEERYFVDLARVLSFDGERTAPVLPRAPFVGMGCTVCSFTDRDAGTIVELDPGGRWVRVQLDRATRTDENGMSECQTYTYTRDPGGEIFRFKRGRKGWANEHGTKTLTLGVRRSYHDFSY